MSIQPFPGAHRVIYGPAVSDAEKVLRDFGAQNRPEAGLIFPLWHGYGELTRAERRAVLDRFADVAPDRPTPAAGVPLPAGVEGWALGGVR